MAKNDTILIDGILDDRVLASMPSNRRDEVFEYFAFEQILRDYDLSQDEIVSGWVDGRDDGGIDGFFILVNGHLLNDVDSFVWPKSGCELEVWIVCCKHHETFRQAPMDNLVASLNELFDFALVPGEFKGAYSDDLIKARNRLLHAYRKVSSHLTKFSVRLAYVSRGDSCKVGESIRARATQAESIVKGLFGNCDSMFAFVGASELISIHRKVKTFSLELPFLDSLSRGERYVLLCRLSDFYRFAIDENAKLRRYLFDSNVRAFMGLNRVNEDIRDTLSNSESPDFWWLNNGITILANSAIVIGKAIKLDGVQIVNGLQTTESISQYFSAGGADSNERAVLVKVIVSTDSAIRDAIIRATNNQTAVELASLHATDKIQRDIEEVLLREGFLYERRTKYYSGQGYSNAQIIAPLYLAAGYVSLVLKLPSNAASLKSKFMRLADSYAKVFSPSTPLQVWPVIAGALKKTDAALETVRPVGTMANEKFLKNWRQITSLIAVARVCGTFSFSVGDLIKCDLLSINEKLILETWEFIKATLGTDFTYKKKVGRDGILALAQKAAAAYSLKGVEMVEQARFMECVSRELSPEFIAKVNATLPEQPWRPGVHGVVAKILGCRKSDVYEATNILVKNKQRHVQKDGIVYGDDGNVIAVDPTRHRVEHGGQG